MTDSPIKILEEDLLIHLSSRNATIFNNNTKLSDVSFRIPDINLHFEKKHYYKEVSFLHGQFINSLNSINSYNNTIKYVIASVNYQIVIQNGNYYYSNFISEILSKFQANGHTFTITRNEVSSILTFSYSQEFTFLDCSGLSLIGLSTSKSSTSNVLICDYPYNILGNLNNKLKIQSKNLIFDSYYPNGAGKILAVIPLNASSGDYLHYENSFNLKSILKNHSLEQIDIQIVDDDDNLVDFQNFHWAMTLKITFYREFDLTIKEPLN